jgi:hypothetical protein
MPDRPMLYIRRWFSHEAMDGDDEMAEANQHAAARVLQRALRSQSRHRDRLRVADLAPGDGDAAQRRAARRQLHTLLCAVRSSSLQHDAAHSRAEEATVAFVGPCPATWHAVVAARDTLRAAVAMHRALPADSRFSPLRLLLTGSLPWAVALWEAAVAAVAAALLLITPHLAALLAHVPGDAVVGRPRTEVALSLYVLAAAVALGAAAATAALTVAAFQRVARRRDWMPTLDTAADEQLALWVGRAGRSLAALPRRRVLLLATVAGWALYAATVAVLLALNPAVGVATVAVCLADEWLRRGCDLFAARHAREMRWLKAGTDAACRSQRTPPAVTPLRPATAVLFDDAGGIPLPGVSYANEKRRRRVRLADALVLQGLAALRLLLLATAPAACALWLIVAQRQRGDPDRHGDVVLASPLASAAAPLTGDGERAVLALSTLLYSAMASGVLWCVTWAQADVHRSAAVAACDVAALEAVAVQCRAVRHGDGAEADTALSAASRPLIPRVALGAARACAAVAAVGCVAVFAAALDGQAFSSHVCPAVIGSCRVQLLIDTNVTTVRNSTTPVAWALQQRSAVARAPFGLCRWERPLRNELLDCAMTSLRRVLDGADPSARPQSAHGLVVLGLRREGERPATLRTTFAVTFAGNGSSAAIVLPRLAGTADTTPDAFFLHDGDCD